MNKHYNSTESIYIEKIIPNIFTFVCIYLHISSLKMKNIYTIFLCISAYTQSQFLTAKYRSLNIYTHQYDSIHQLRGFIRESLDNYKLRALHNAIYIQYTNSLPQSAQFQRTKRACNIHGHHSVSFRTHQFGSINQFLIFSDYIQGESKKKL